MDDKMFEAMVEAINSQGYGFRVARPTFGWTSPWISIDHQGLATPVSNQDVVNMYVGFGL
jgi:hypothetical protein